MGVGDADGVLWYAAAVMKGHVVGHWVRSSWRRGDEGLDGVTQVVDGVGLKVLIMCDNDSAPFRI